MNKILRFGLIGLWILLTTGLFTRCLLTYFKMPAYLPESFWLWSGHLFDIQDAEGQVALEVWLGLSFSLFAASLLAWLLWCRFKID